MRVCVLHAASCAHTHTISYVLSLSPSSHLYQTQVLKYKGLLVRVPTSNMESSRILSLFYSYMFPSLINFILLVIFWQTSIKVIVGNIFYFGVKAKKMTISHHFPDFFFRLWKKPSQGKQKEQIGIKTVWCFLKKWNFHFTQ